VILFPLMYLRRPHLTSSNPVPIEEPVYATEDDVPVADDGGDVFLAEPNE